MNGQLIIKNDVFINTSPARVWDVLVNPTETKKYMYGCEPVTDWKPGSMIEWVGVFDGKEIVAVTGKVVRYDQDKLLSYTTFDPNGGYDDKPENHLVVTYQLTEKNGGTEFTVTQGDYSKVAEGKKRYEDSLGQGGWSAILEQVKILAEQ